MVSCVRHSKYMINKMNNQVKTYPILPNSKNIYQIISYLLVLTGISIRIYHYLMNKSFWLDEALLSNNIINKNFAELLEPLNNLQIAPIGFLFAQKISVLLFGANEFALRLFPLLSGISSVIFFYLLLKRIVNEKIVVLGLVLFIFGKSLLYFSQEAKQYNLDVLCYIVLFYFFYRRKIVENSYIKLIIIGISGGILVWFSHISIIILFCISIILFLETLFKEDKKRLVKLLIPIAIWGLSICVNYFFFLHNNSNETDQIKAFTSINYFPPTPFKLENLSWFYFITIHLIEYPLGTLSGIFVFSIMLLGIFNIIRTKKYWILLMGTPILLHFVLSLLKLYPFYSRFILYTTVYIIVLVLMGFELIIRWKSLWGYIASCIFVLAIMARPIKNCLTPFYFEEIRPVISYVEKKHQQDDIVYIHSAASHSYKFYEQRFDLPPKVIIGNTYTFNQKKFDLELDKIKEMGESRVWILFSHISEDQKKLFLDQTLKIGDLISNYELPGASVHLIRITK
jgi:hypothetical protein